MAWTNALITTRRVTLRCPTDEDRPAISRVLTDPDVRRFLGGPVSDEDLAAFASRPIGRQTGLFVAVLAETGRTIGTFALDDERDDRELSYQLLPEFWGQGLALEACGALLTWGWTELDVGSIIAVTQSSNVRSLRLLDRLGFAPDTVFEEYGDCRPRCVSVAQRVSIERRTVARLACSG